MKLSSVRSLNEIKYVLKDILSSGPDPVYWVFSDMPGEWVNMTVISPGCFTSVDGVEEYPKTFGHYHGSTEDETYRLELGTGILLLQRKHLEDNQWIPGKVDEVLLIKAKPGDEIKITSQWGHSWSNIGQQPLVSFDNWRSGHSPSDYEEIEKLQGMAYYFVSDQGEVKAVANPRYQDLPQPVWLTAEEFAMGGHYSSFDY